MAKMGYKLMDLSVDKKRLSIGRGRFVLYGFLLWTLWVIFYSIVFKLQVGVPWLVALFVSAENYYIFALLSVGIWALCRKIPYGRLPVPIFVFIHFTLAMICSVLWLALTYGIWYLQSGKEIFKFVEIEKIIGWEFLFGMITYLLLAGIFYTIIYYKHYREEELREAELKLLTRDAELKALKLQVNPHFLFNSLNSINALVTENPQLARRMITRLSELLRMALESHERLLLPLKEELAFVHTYLEIERIRFGERLVYEELVDHELLTQPFPAMLLQPLVENAVKHGIVNSRRGGRIELKMRVSGDKITCSVRNTLPEEADVVEENHNQSGRGLSNIRQRLERLYEGDYRLQIDRSNSPWFEVSLSLPLKSGV